jgi:hypothetical protein
MLLSFMLSSLFFIQWENSKFYSYIFSSDSIYFSTTLQNRSTKSFIPAACILDQSLIFTVQDSTPHNAIGTARTLEYLNYLDAITT